MDNFKNKLEIARKARSERKYSVAAGHYEQLAKHTSDPWKAYRDAALCMALDGNVIETTRLFELYFYEKDKPKFAALNDLLSLYHKTGKHECKSKAINHLLNPQSFVVNNGRKSKQVMVFALPKSAGTSVVKTLAEALRIGSVASGSDDSRTPGYSAAVLEPLLLQRLSGQILLHQTHAMPWRENLELLRKNCFSKFVVHLRDPRDALLSYYYMAEQYELHRLRLMILFPDYDQLDPPSRMQLLARTIYFRFIEWITGWVAVADAVGGKAIVTSFERFRRDPTDFFKDLTAFLSGKEQAVGDVKRIHFRKGSVGQVEDPLLPPILRKELYDYIPAELARRFGWEV